MDKNPNKELPKVPSTGLNTTNRASSSKSPSSSAVPSLPVSRSLSWSSLVSNATTSAQADNYEFSDIKEEPNSDDDETVVNQTPDGYIRQFAIANPNGITDFNLEESLMEVGDDCDQSDQYTSKQETDNGPNSHDQPNPVTTPIEEHQQSHHQTIKKEELDSDVDESTPSLHKLHNQAHEKTTDLSDQSIKQETEAEQVSTQFQQSTTKACKRVKKEEDGANVNDEWDGDECDCEECRVDREREIKFEINYANACKRVKKEEDGGEIKCEVKQENEQTDGEDQMEVIEVDDDSDQDNDQVDDDEMADEDNDNEHDKSSFGEVLTRPSTSRSRSNHARRWFVCTICYKRLVTPSSLEDHIRLHTGEMPFVCQFEGCTKAYNRKESLRMHFKMQHSEILELKVCQQCGQSFRYQNSFKIHLQTHSGEMPFKCRFCNMGYKSYYSLKKHIKSHW